MRKRESLLRVRRPLTRRQKREKEHSNHRAQFGENPKSKPWWVYFRKQITTICSSFQDRGRKRCESSLFCQDGIVLVVSQNPMLSSQASPHPHRKGKVLGTPEAPATGDHSGYFSEGKMTSSR